MPGKFLGYALYAGGIWKGDITVANIEKLEEMGASELHARWFNEEEVSMPQRDGNFIFPSATEQSKFLGQELRTSTLIRGRPERGEEQDNLHGKSDE